MSIFSDDQAAERKDQKRLREKFKTSQLSRDNAVKQLVQSIEGREYLRWLLFTTGAVGVNSFRTDPHDTAFQCGIQWAGQQILAHLLEVDPNTLALLLKEPDDGIRTDQADLFGEDAGDDRAGNGADNGSALDGSDQADYQ